MAAKAGPASEKQKIHKMAKFASLLALIGFLMVLLAIYMEFGGPFNGIPDSESSRTLMTLKLGGIGFLLTGIFISLLAILKALAAVGARRR